MRTLSIRAKILLATTVSAVIIGTVALVVNSNVNALVTAQQQLSKTQQTINLIFKLQGYLVDMETGTRGFMLSGSDQFLEPYNTGEESFEATVRELNELLADSPDMLAEIAEMRELKAQWIEGPAVSENMAKRKWDRGMFDREKFESTIRSSGGKELTDKVREMAGKAIQALETKQQQLGASNIQIAESTTMWSSVGLGAAVLIGMLLLYVISNSITRTVRGLIEQLIVSASQVKQASSELVVSGRNLAQRSTDQAQSIQDSAASLQEIEAMACQNAGNAQQADTLGDSARERVVAGSEMNSRMSEAMDAISSSADQTVEIVKLIDEIAFQTNLLALNAAVEAARAGDAGKGFAVVAEEVRNLAQRSAEAAKNTSEKIQRSKELVEEGVSISDDMRQGLQSIQDTVEQSANLTKEIAAASGEQSVGIGEANRGVTSLDRLAKDNALSAQKIVEEGSLALKQVHELGNVISAFSSLVNGGKGHNPDKSTPNDGAKAKQPSPPTTSRGASISGDAPGTQAPPTNMANGSNRHGGISTIDVDSSSDASWSM